MKILARNNNEQTVFLYLVCVVPTYFHYIERLFVFGILTCKLMKQNRFALIAKISPYNSDISCLRHNYVR